MDGRRGFRNRLRGGTFGSLNAFRDWQPAADQGRWRSRTALNSEVGLHSGQSSLLASDAPSS